MDMHPREQYLETLREEYRGASEKQKKRLLNEARERTRLNRKVLIRKPAHAALAKAAGRRRRCVKTYGGEVKAPLAQLWEMFDYPCGQRLAPIWREQGERLRAHERQVRQLKRQRRAPVHPLLYQRVPVKLPNEWDREAVGNLQADSVVHCGRSSAGEYLHTLSVVDIASGWWEGEPHMGRSQKATEKGFEALRLRFPFRVRELHPDNYSALLNELLWNYRRKKRIAMSRSRPYQKNDNAWVEQKNWTHVRKVVGYWRYDRPGEQALPRELRRKLAEFQNFSSAGEEAEGEGTGGKIHRIYDEPYQCRREWGGLNRKQREELKSRYQALNPAWLHREIQLLRDQLSDSVESIDEEVVPPAHRHGPGIELKQAGEQRLCAAPG